MFRVWKYVALHTFFIWAPIESALSNTIPKLRALGEATISEDAIWRLFVLGLDWWYLEVMTRNSVLSSFSFSLLTVIHNFMSLMHDSIFARESFSSLSSFKSKDRYSWVSSAYICTCNSCLRAMLAIGDEYMVKINAFVFFSQTLPLITVVCEAMHTVFIQTLLCLLCSGAIYVTPYRKRYLMALATSYWFGINKLCSHISAQQSFQVKRFMI